MCGRAFSPRFLFTWPNSRISVMGGYQAADVLTQIAKKQSKSRGESWCQNKANIMKSSISNQFEREGSPYYSSARLWDDGIIDPNDTRKILALILRVVDKKYDSETKYGIFRM